MSELKKTTEQKMLKSLESLKTELGKINAAALAMIETRMDLIKAVLLKHEVAVIEVMCELHQQQQADEALLRQCVSALEGAITYDWHGNPSEDYDRECAALVAALRERLGEAT